MCNVTYPSISSIHPTQGPITGNTFILINGRYLEPSHRPVFVSGSKEMTSPQCQWLSSSQINCTTPAFGSVNVTQVHIPVQNNWTLSYTPPSFAFYSQPTVSKYLGTSGPTSGGTQIRLLADGGSEFPTGNIGQVKLRLTSNDESVVQVLNSARISRQECEFYTSSFSKEGNYSVEVTFNDQLFGAVQYVPFFVYNPFRYTFSPKSGLQTGQTVITVTPITQTQFPISPTLSDDQPVAKFVHSSSVELNSTGIVISDGQSATLQFVSPDFSVLGNLDPTTGTVTELFAASNGQQFLPMSFGSRNFHLYTNHSISSEMEPRSVPVSTGVVIHVLPAIGLSFANVAETPQVRVRLQDNSVQFLEGTRVSSVRIRANLPQIANTGVVHVSVSLNRQQFSEEIRVRVFSLISASPQYVDRNGGTTITAVGREFENTADLRCRITFSGQSLPNIPATFVSNTTVLCRVPNALTTSLGQSLTLQVKTNQDRYSTNLVQMIGFSTPTVTSLSPNQVEQQTPNQQVNIFGTNFIQSPLLIVRFGSVDIASAAITVVSETNIRVVAPLFDASVVTVEVSINGQQFTTNAIEFTYTSVGCPQNTFVPSGATPTAKTDCKCRPLFYSLTGEDGKACEPCSNLVGADCPGLGSPPVAAPGFFTTASFTFVRCAEVSACLGGANNTCSKGYTGVLCNTCIKGYYKLGSGCQPCLEGDSSQSL
eukprot:TRINITY_DN4744_c0_g1_i11.p1 TRINITY_DN4744_c0_g1~~TRINITY_DN4744_c0_g1_i11.p1  ORF type:complete len:709 (+),score=172.43 TRINITY_DN4744_c0_g1_i11:724-2850(+)